MKPKKAALNVDCSRLIKATEKATKALAELEIAIALLGIEEIKPKWWQFWKWEWFNLKPLDRNGIDYYQPTENNLTTPPRGKTKTQNYGYDFEFISQNTITNSLYKLHELYKDNDDGLKKTLNKWNKSIKTLHKLYNKELCK